jgi:hypothetical protein
MNRRKFLCSVPVLAAYGLVASVFGRLFGREKARPFSAGRLRREPELMNVDRDNDVVYMTDGTMREANPLMCFADANGQRIHDLDGLVARLNAEWNQPCDT